MQRNKRLIDPQQDGGRIALVGFVPQMLGSVGDFVRSISHTEQDGDKEVGTLFEIETHGQDQSEVAGAPGGLRRRILTQYKYSLTNRKIDKQEMIDIARALRHSAAS